MVTGECREARRRCDLWTVAGFTGENSLSDHYKLVGTFLFVRVEEIVLFWFSINVRFGTDKVMTILTW